VSKALFLAMLGLGLLTLPLFAQEALPARVFLDCNAFNCDFDHVRRTITWVDWVRDRQDSDVHLLVTFERTGGGGWRYTLDYIGRGDFAGVEKSLAYVSDPDDTDAEVRDGLTQTMAVGLVQFVEGTPISRRLHITYETEESRPLSGAERDPWNLWVFELGVDGSLEGQSQESNYSLGGSIEANRVSERLKVNIELDADYDHDRFELDDGTDVVNTSERYTADVLAVWSLSEHWSLGGTTVADRSTFLNRDLAVSAGPSIEFNVFPYRESTRRQLTIRYTAELAAFNYELETVESQLSEVLGLHRLLIGIEVTQPWGEIFGSVEGIQYFHDLATHRINTELRLEYRLFRGFDFEVFAEFARIKDQFYLPKEGLTEQEVLLRRRQRETDFQFDIGIGLSYRFGSSFANVVNPRMGRF
jgi:hypothetical protein